MRIAEAWCCLLLPALLVACTRQAPSSAAEQTTSPAADAAPAASQPAMPAQTPPPDANEGVEGYRARASGLLPQLVVGADLGAARRDTEALMALGAALVPAFVSKHPHCRDYLDVALQVRTAWPALDLETIERDYHRDGVLPKIENSTVCYHMKDLIVHPATVLVLLAGAQPDLAKARSEIEEVIGHAGFVAPAE